MIALAAALALVGGCGRPTLPGSQFSEGEVQTTTAQRSTSPLPEEPVLQWGDPDAKVRVAAYYPIDDDHQRLREVLEEIAATYGDEVYVQYADPRTPEGGAMFQRAQLQARTVLVNGESTKEIEKSGIATEVTFAQEMGRFWTADDLKMVVADEVAKVREAGS
jgi:hypothetical protein